MEVGGKAALDSLENGRQPMLFHYNLAGPTVPLQPA